MQDDQHYIDKIFREALTDFQDMPDEGAWEGIAAGVVAPEVVATKAVLFKKYLGMVLVSAYLLVGPLFYTDVLFTNETGINELQAGPNNQPLVEERAEEEMITDQEITQVSASEQEIEPVEVVKEDLVNFKEPESQTVNVTKAKEKMASPLSANDGQRISFLSFDQTKQEVKQEESGEQQSLMRPLVEVEDVLVELAKPGYAYRTFLFPVLEDAVPIDSVDDFEYYEQAWKWYGSAYVMPVYWSGSGLGRAQLGFDVGRYLSPNASVQAGLRYQLSSGEPQMGDVSVLTIPIQYRRHFGRGAFRWYLGAGAVVIPGASPGRPFDRSFYSSSLLDMEFSGGMIYHPSDKMRFFVSPTWQQPFSGDHGISVQLGIQFKF